MRIYRGAYVREPLESRGPHEIVDSDGRRRVPMPGFPVFKDKGSATRWLHYLIRMYDKRRHDGRDDPRSWSVRPLKEGA
jgi:hypothetical protein